MTSLPSHSMPGTAPLRPHHPTHLYLLPAVVRAGTTPFYAYATHYHPLPGPVQPRKNPFNNEVGVAQNSPN